MSAVPLPPKAKAILTTETEWKRLHEDLVEALELLNDAPPVGTDETVDWVRRRDALRARIEGEKR